MKDTVLEVAHTWMSDAALVVDIEAPLHDDAPPLGAAGSWDGLWDFEVVELFLLGSRERYLELECGPHGHYLVLQLQGPRQVRERGLALDYRVERTGDRWTALDW